MVDHRLVPDFPLAGLRLDGPHPRTITAAGRKALAASLDRHGHVGVLVVRVMADGSHRLVAGHQRLEWLLGNGHGTAPAFVVTCSDTDEQHLAVVLNGHAGRWDAEALDAILRSLQAAGEDLGQLRQQVDAKALDHLLDELRRVGADGQVDPDACPPVQPTTVQPGDVWILGDHRLVVGDSTQGATWYRLMGDERHACLVTDPPYNVAYEGAAGSIENDDMDDAAFHRFLVAALGPARGFAGSGAACYIFHAESASAAFRLAARDAGWSIRQTLIWIKDHAVLSRQDYHWRHEPILYGWADGAPHRWCADRRQDTVWSWPGVDITPAPDGTGHDLTITTGDQVCVLRVPSYRVVLGDSAQTTAWNHPRPSRNPDHPTMKPVALIERILANSTEPGDLVADPFSGSGSTLLACERLGRRARCIELDPKFADVIIRRWQDFTGRTAQREASHA